MPPNNEVIPEGTKVLVVNPDLNYRTVAWIYQARFQAGAPKGYNNWYRLKPKKKGKCRSLPWAYGVEDFVVIPPNATKIQIKALKAILCPLLKKAH